MAHNKSWIKSLWALKDEAETRQQESLWDRVSEMVGYERGSVPVGADCTLSPVVDPPDPPPRLVCSPDLPVFPTPDSSTTTLNCSYCNKSFTQKTAYQNHLKTHVRDGEQQTQQSDPYQCNFCGKVFAVPARLTRHYRTHTGEKPYQCEYCHKSFSVKENLSVHRRIHTKERPYKCEVCERAFEHSGKLHRHMRIHTGERPHKCNVCGKTFIQSGQLVIHTRTHTGEKPYVCKDCGKGFTCSKQLKVHNRTHTGEKPYSCEICGKSFGYNHVLKLHQVAHYGEKVYKCTICSETFTSKKSMEAHIKTHSSASVSENAQTSATRSPDEPETSCGSTNSSDKENTKTIMVEATTWEMVDEGKDTPGTTTWEIIHTEKPSGVNPALLAAVAIARDTVDPTDGNLIIDNEPTLTIDFEDELSPPSSPTTEVVREELILPPRKRSKAYMKSMETEKPVQLQQVVRYNSVIQYARAS